jgi:hypothetical protein
MLRGRGTKAMISADGARPTSAARIFAPEPRTVVHTSPRQSTISANDVMTDSSAIIVSSSNLSTGNANRASPFHVHVLFVHFGLVKLATHSYGAHPFHMGSTIPVPLREQGSSLPRGSTG